MIISPCRSTSHRLDPHYQVGKPRVCVISEWTMNALTTESGLVLAAVDFGGKYTRELGQLKV